MISFVIPVFNCKKHIWNCVNSIVKLSELSDDIEVEIILIDDGSNDGSSDVCDQISKQVKNVYVIHQKNKGVSAARNCGIEKAKGEYITFVDVDDTIDAVLLEEVLKKITSDKSVDMAIYGVAFDYYYHDLLDYSELYLPPYEGIRNINECELNIQQLFDTNCLSSLWQRIIKKEILINNQLRLDEKMFLYEDLEFNLRTLPYCERILFCQLPVYHYKQTNEGDNAAIRIQRIEHIPIILNAIKIAMSYLSDKNVIDSILYGIYAVLIRKKISLCHKSEILSNCKDFKEWIDEKSLYSAIKDDKYAISVYRGNVTWLVVFRKYAQIRHRIAEAIKHKVRKQ